MPFVETGGPRLYYEESGSGEPLVLVMGLGGDHMAWAEQVPAWSEHFRVIAFDNRDCGRSSYVDEGYTVADMAEDLRGLADALELERFHLLGLSMGGTIAQELALRRPERVLTLTLALSWGGSGRWGRERARLMANAALRTPREEHVEQMLLACLSEEALDDAGKFAYFRKLSLEHPHPQDPEGFRRQVQALGDHDARERLPGLRMPVHVIGAAHDLMIPVWKSEELAELIPGARLSVMGDAPHAVNLERPEEFNALVLEFLLDGERRAAA